MEYPAYKARVAALLHSKAQEHGRVLPPALREALLYALEGGKCIRGALVFSAYESLEGEAAFPPELESLAAAVELLHAYTLVHDDLPSMDNDTYRRGKLSVHAKFGEAQGLLVGDLLHALAFKEASRPDSSVFSGLLSEASARLVEGQYLDLHTPQPPSAQALHALATLKTKPLIACALEVGARLSPRYESCKESIAKLGEVLGLGFQLQDDLEDLSGPSLESALEWLSGFAPSLLEAEPALSSLPFPEALSPSLKWLRSRLDSLRRAP